MKLSKNFLPIALIIGGVGMSIFTFQHHQQQKTGYSAATGGEASKQKALQKSQVDQNQITVEPKVINYQCDNQRIVQANYDQAPALAASKTVILTLDEQPYKFGYMPSAIGNLYATTQPNSLGQHMRWLVQGLEARLLVVLPDPVTHAENEQLLLRCQQPI